MLDASPPSPSLVRPIILGSTSRYRRELLQRLRLPFTAAAPLIDETPLPGETPPQLAERLALAKARAVAAVYPDAIVIGSDQVCDLDGHALGKPGTHDRAVAQLQAMRGRSVVFHTAIAVVCQHGGFCQSHTSRVTVQFRTLSDAEIERYLHIDQPYDCAGSAKSESLGISLLEAIHSDDPTALIGLPLIATARLLREAGVPLP